MRMQRIVYRTQGPSDVLELVQCDAPTPGEGEVRVRLMRAGVNPTDWKFRAGVAPMEYPEVTPGQDGAGVVDAVGPGVTDVGIGDRVWVILGQNGRPYGTAAEYTVQPRGSVAHLPEGASFDLGASLGVPAVTAHCALTSARGSADQLAAGTLRGRSVLVAGGAGAVGNAAIQLAVWAGATVVATVSTAAKAELAHGAGAHHVVNYVSSNAEEAIRRLVPQGVDLVVEVAPAQNNAMDIAVASNRATIAIYANNGGDTVTIPVRRTFAKNLRYQFILLYYVDPRAIQEAAAAINEAISDGAFGVGERHGLPLSHFGLDDTAAAHDAVENGAIGKVLIDIA